MRVRSETHLACFKLGFDQDYAAFMREPVKK
jgi:hypothetical protein